jgi:predicted NBD/HSP70 family sugar kinase
VCKCKRTGCIEAYAGSWAIRECYKKQSQKKNIESITLEEVMQAFLDGEEAAVKTVERAVYYLGVGLANIVMLLDVQLIVINGLPATGREEILKLINDAMWNHFLYPVYKIEIIAEDLLEEEKALGGAKRVRDSYLNLRKRQQ